MEGDQHSHQTPPRQHSTPLLGLGLPVPVITRTSSLPATPSLEWDRSCLQEPLLLDAGNLLGIERLEDRRVSDTDPHLVDNQKILLVSTESSSTFEKLLESAGNIPSTVMAEMDNEANDLFMELDTLTSKMRANPVTDMEEELVDSFVTRLERLTNDVENCLGLFNVWKRKHRNESNVTLKEQVEQEVTSMENTFRAYRKSISDKKKQLQPLATALVVSITIVEAEFKNMEQQELFSSEKARVQDGGEFSKFKIQTLTPAPVCKDDSSYLLPS